MALVVLKNPMGVTVRVSEEKAEELATFGGYTRVRTEREPKPDVPESSEPARRGRPRKTSE